MFRWIMGILDRSLPPSLVKSIRKSKKDCTCAMGSTFVIGMAYALLASPYYISEARILPPKQAGQEFMMAMGVVGSLDVGGNLFRDPNQAYASILSSRTIAQAAVDSFKLIGIYKKKNRSRAVKEFLDRQSVKVSSKDGVISISYRDRDPERSKAIVQFCIDSFLGMVDGYHRLESEKKESIIRVRLDQVSKEIGAVNAELSRLQGRLGITVPEKEAEASANSAGKIGLYIAERKTELASLSLRLGAQHPEILALRKQISSLQSQLRDQGVTQETSRNFVEVDSVLRKKMILQATFEALIKQVEITTLAKSKSNVEVQILDLPTLAEEKNGPHRTLIVAISLFLGVMVSCVIVIARMPRDVG